MTPEVEKVLTRLKGMGINVIIGEDEVDNAVQPAPFSWKLGLDYAKKTLYFDGACDAESVGNLIHEAGHLVACEKSPEDSEEYEFLGWEIALALELDLLDDWAYGQQDYGVTTNEYEGGIEIGLLSDEEFDELVEERIDYARSIGLVVVDRAVAIR